MNDSGIKYLVVQFNLPLLKSCLPFSPTFSWIGEMKLQSRLIIKEEVAVVGSGSQSKEDVCLC